MTEGSIGKSLFFFAVPVLLGNVLQSLNGTINSIWIGNFLGEDAFAGTANANNIMFFLLSTIFGIGMAATILIGQNVGANDLNQAKKVVGTSALFFAVLSLLIAAAGIILSPDILRWMHTPEASLGYAISYLRIIFVGIPFMFFYNFLMMVLRGSGNSKTPFYFLLVSSFLDIVLNPLLIFGPGPVPALGIAGSATATAIAQIVSLVLLMVYLYRTGYALRLTRADMQYLRLDPGIVWVLVKKGFPMGLQMIVVSTSGLALINLVNSFGPDATAAFGAAMQLASYVQMPAMAIGGAVSSIAAQNVGANKWDRVHRTTLMGITVNFLMTGVLVGLIYLFNRQALDLFLNGEKALRLGMDINTITLWPFILFGITFVVSGVVRSTGAVMAPLGITFFALWCVRIPLAYYLGRQYGLVMLWWSFPIGFLMGTLLSGAYYLWGGWRRARMMAPSGKDSPTAPAEAESGPASS